MKKRILILALALLVMIAAFTLTACEGIVIPGITGSGGGTGTPTSYTVTYRYNNATVLTQTVNAGLALSAAQIAEKDALAHKGLKFTGFYSDSSAKTEFDFSKAINQNTTVYCQLLYTVSYYFGDQVILEQKVNSIGALLSDDQINDAKALKYRGHAVTGWFADPEKTTVYDVSIPLTGNVKIYCQILSTVEYRYGTELIFSQQIDSSVGFTEEHLKERDAKLYHGFNLDYFYADSLKTAKFDFETKPFGTTTVYCDRDYNKAGANVTWRVLNATNGETTLYFEGEGPMYEYLFKEDVPWGMYYSTITNISIEEGITSIADCAFYEFSSITSVTFPNTLSHIGNNAFRGSSITDIEFPDSLRTIGEFAFRDCAGLTELLFNAGLTNIKDGAFWACENVGTVILTNTIISFGTSAFQECNNLSTAYYIGTQEQYDSIKQNIDNHWLDLFAHKYYLSQEEPEAVGPYWYYDENGDISQWYYSIWYIDPKTPSIPFLIDYVDAKTGVTQENIDTMSNIVYHGYEYVGWKRKDDSSAYTLTEGDIFTSDLKLIGDRGNVCGENLTWTYKNGILTINGSGKMWDFEYYNDAPWYSKHESISRVVISSAVTHIGSFAFVEILNKSDYYTSFTYIDIPASVTSIASTAFNGSTHLLYIYYAGDADALEDVEGINSLDGVSDAKVYTYADPDDFSTLGEGSYWTYLVMDSAYERRVAWSYFDGELLVGGGNKRTIARKVDSIDHVMFDYESNADTPWYSYRNDVTSVVINKNITSVGDYSFDAMTSVESISVTHISDKITFISSTAFSGTGYYNKMYAEKGVVYVYNDDENPTFRNVHLIRVNPDMAPEVFIIDETALSIAEGAFDGCSSIKHLVFPKNIGPKCISAGAMNGLVSLEGIYFDGSIDTWNNQYENTLTKEGELLYEVPVYIYSALKPTDATKGYWAWNPDKTAPVIWES